MSSECAARECEKIQVTTVRATRAGDKVDLVVRPRRSSYAAAEAYANCFGARIVDARFLGDHVRVRLAALGRDDFVVKLPHAPG
jgi:putative spermidine/putrescine transport system ATP-binding protein